MNTIQFLALLEKNLLDSQKNLNDYKKQTLFQLAECLTQQLKLNDYKLHKIVNDLVKISGPEVSLLSVDDQIKYILNNIRKRDSALSTIKFAEHKYWDQSVPQRRMDSLARLLSVSPQYTPCIAVAIRHKHLYIGSNFSDQPEIIEKILNKKVELIRKFLKEMLVYLPEGQNNEKISFTSNEQIIFPIFLQRFALELAHEFLERENGGADLKMSSQASISPLIVLQRSLLKVGEYYCKGKLLGDEKGFDAPARQALMNNKINIIFPKTKTHAEQILVHYLTKANTNSSAANSTLHIGISKLCCEACYNYLTQQKEVSFRGGHGIAFLGVLHLGSNRNYPAAFRPYIGSLGATDSDSELDAQLRLQSTLEGAITQEINELSGKNSATENLGKREEVEQGKKRKWNDKEGIEEDENELSGKKQKIVADENGKNQIPQDKIREIPKPGQRSDNYSKHLNLFTPLHELATESNLSSLNEGSRLSRSTNV